MFRIGIIGAGHIARKMMHATIPLKDVKVHAIASRSIGKAMAFAEEFHIEKAYGSYEEAVCDPDIDLIYIGTPNSHHFDHAMLALNHNKQVLVEKAFTLNARQAEVLIETSREKGLFLAEAIWTRYMPLSRKIKEILDSGAIGTPYTLTATLCYNVVHKERITRPELGGGALLDLGVYTLNFARMYFGDDIERTSSSFVVGPTGVDLHESISLLYRDGRVANLQSGVLCQNDRQGIISGTEGYIRVDNINCPEVVEVFRSNELVQRWSRPEDMINGFEYQVLECKRCIESGLHESPMMPHEETLNVMRQMDSLRKEWGIIFPADR